MDFEALYKGVRALRTPVKYISQKEGSRVKVLTGQTTPVITAFLIISAN